MPVQQSNARALPDHHEQAYSIEGEETFSMLPSHLETLPPESQCDKANNSSQRQKKIGNSRRAAYRGTPSRTS